MTDNIKVDTSTPMNTNEAKGNQVVKLNIGGTPVYAFYPTLVKSSNFFKQLLQKPASGKVFVNNDEIFIDRDPIIFTNLIMKYMRLGIVDSPTPFEEQAFYETLKEEAIFYQIKGLIELCEEALAVTGYKKYFIMDFDSLKDLANSRKGKMYGNFEYIDISELTRIDGAVHLISILRRNDESYDDDESEVLFLVRKDI